MHKLLSILPSKVIIEGLHSSCSFQDRISRSALYLRTILYGAVWRFYRVKDDERYLDLGTIIIVWLKALRCIFRIYKDLTQNI